MRLTFNIAKAELRYFFFSPIAWFILIVFLVVSAGVVLGQLTNVAISQDAYIELKGASFHGFTNMPLTKMILRTAMNSIQNIFFLFTPLLTMGVINREYAGGTMKLLHSSPVSIRQIILGKFVGVYAFTCLMLLLFAIVLTIFALSIRDVEFLHMAAMLLSFFLQAAAYIAIGMFISSLTTYPVVAGIGTFVALGIMSSMGDYLQNYDYIRDVTYFLSVSGRTERMQAGLITTRDLIYFAAIVTLFLSFTMIKTKSVTESKSWRVSAGRYVTALSVTIVVLLASSRHGWIGYWDATRSKVNTLHNNTVNVVKQLDGSPLKVTLYTNLLGFNLPYGLPGFRNNYIWNYWDKYLRFYRNIELNYVYYYDVKQGDSAIYRAYPGKTLEQIAEKVADIYQTRLSLFIKPAQIRRMIDLEKEERKGLLMQVEYKGKKTILRTYEDDLVFADEMQMSGGLLRLLNDTTPTYKFLSSHYERSPLKYGEREYGAHGSFQGARGSLVNEGLNVDTSHQINFSAFTGNEVLVIADPKTVLGQAAIDSVNQYIDRGGNAIFHTEPGKQFIMNPILNHIGVNADDGTIVRINPHEMPHKFSGIITKKGTQMSDEGELFMYRNDAKDTCRTNIFGASNLSYTEKNGFKIEPIATIYNNPETWIERGTLVVDSAAPVFNAAEGDIRLNKPYTVALQLTRKINNKEQRIVITGDGDIMAAMRLSGYDFANSFYSFTIDNKMPVYHNLKVPLDIWLNIKKGTAKTMGMLMQYIIPACILIIGIIVLVRRKRK